MSLIGNFRETTSEWETFKNRHPDWVGRVAQLGPIYRLPAEVITRLSAHEARTIPVLNQDTYDTEREFIDLCGHCNSIGFSKGQPLCYSHLLSSLKPPDETDRKKHNWTQSQLRGLLQCVKKIDEAKSRVKGVTGWLMTEPAFLDESKKLRSLWEAMTDDDRPRFPLSRGGSRIVAEARSNPLASHSILIFHNEFVAFCNRWCLAAMVTWDLPVPQGPLFPSLLKTEAPATPCQGITLFIPMHYPMQGDDDLQRQILDAQKRMVEAQGINASLAGLPHHEIYGQMFEVAFVESVATARYGTPRRPKGFVDRLNSGLAAYLNRSVGHVQRLRRAVTACRRGNREQIKLLKPRPR